MFHDEFSRGADADAPTLLTVLALIVAFVIGAGLLVLLVR